jgi:hypothetical protein
MTAKEYAEKYVGRAVKGMWGFAGIISGYNDKYVAIETNGGSIPSCNPDFTFLRPVKIFTQYIVQSLSFLTAKEMVDKYKDREVEIMNSDNSVYGKGKIVGVNSSGHVIVGNFVVFSPSNIKILPLNATIASTAIDMSKYPHKCPKCSSPAYIGFTSVECSKGC